MLDILTQIGAFIAPFIVGLATKFPVIVTVLFLMGVMRAIFKPIMAVLHAYVESTPNAADDAALEKVEASTWFKVVAWLVDFLGSIKLVK